MTGRWKRWRQLSVDERWLIVEAVFSLFWVRLLLALIPLRVTLKLLRIRPGEMGTGATAEDRAAAIGLAVERAARHVPFRARCLQQAFAGFLMLRRRGLRASLHVGVRRRSDSSLAAHAWSLSGATPVTGIAQAADYVPIAQFTR